MLYWVQCTHHIYDQVNSRHHTARNEDGDEYDQVLFNVLHFIVQLFFEFHDWAYACWAGVGEPENGKDELVQKRENRVSLCFDSFFNSNFQPKKLPTLLLPPR